MSTKPTEIAFILDRSGSMSSCFEAAIQSFNAFLREQKAGSCSTRFTLVLFDDQYDIPHRSVPVAEVQELNASTFIPRGSTALLDALGRTIDEMGARLDKVPAGQRPGQVIVATLTDGHENASTRFTWKEVASRITHQRDVYRWEFLFLGANQDAIATASRIGIPKNFSATYAASAAGTVAAMRSTSRKVRALQKYGEGGILSIQEQSDLETPMQQIVEEENHKAGAAPE